MFKESVLGELASKYRTDKVAHRYISAYEEYFESKREQVKKVCEIGVLRGASLLMWRDYFPKARIIGVDIKPISINGGERIEVVQADQSSEESLILLSNILGKDVDLIVDDGSHFSDHQVLTFKHLFSCLREGGVYVVEDIYPAGFGNAFVNLCLDLVERKFSWPKNIPFKMNINNVTNVELMAQHSLSWQDKNVLRVDVRRSLVFITRGIVGMGSM